MKKGLYDEEMACWIGNHSVVFLFFFGLLLMIQSLLYPFYFLYYKVWGCRRYRNWKGDS